MSRCAQRSRRRTIRKFKGRGERIHFIDGPLANIETIVEAASASALSIGLCIVTKTGPAQVLNNTHHVYFLRDGAVVTAQIRPRDRALRSCTQRVNQSYSV